MAKAPNGGRRPTLATLAADLGVARTTVSNAYNRPDQLSPELRERILTRAAELSYPGPNPAARRLNDSTLTTVGVMFSEKFTYPFVDAAAREFLQGIGAVAETHQLAVLLIPAPVRGPTARNAIENAVLDALVVYSMPDGDDVLAAALARRVPTVIVDQPQLPEGAFVGIDDRRGARMVMEHVLAQGHTRVAVVTFRLGRDSRAGVADGPRQAEAIYAIARQRLAGYRDAVEAAGLDWSDITVFERPEHTYEDGLQAGRALLDDAPTAIVTFTDVLAAGVVDAATERGFRVPEDLSVAGFDDSALAVQYNLTTVHQPLRRKGEEVGHLLIDTWGTEAAAKKVILPVELVLRGSVARPRET